MRRRLWLVLVLVLALGWRGSLTAQERALPQLTVFHRAGQTFVTWSEVGGPEVTYNLYRASAPITADSLDAAELVATAIPQGTARDFIAENVARLAEQPPPTPTNFTVFRKDGPLPDGMGLFVYTPGVKRTSFYVLAAVRSEGGEDRRVRVGVNSQLASVTEGIHTTGPILISREEEGEEVVLDFIHWATPEQASVDGHPYRFRLVTRADEQKSSDRGLVVRLHHFGGNYNATRRTRAGFLTLSLNDFTPAIPAVHHQSFWFGYRENLGRCYLTGEHAKRAGGAGLGAEERSGPVPVRDYTRRRMLWSIEGVTENFRFDRNRVYLTGGSMGGMGTVGLGLRHPQLFAALEAHVPFTNPARSQFYGYRVLGEVWQDENWPQLPDGEGQTLGQRLDDTAYVLSATADLPLLKFFNARQDKVIDWTQIPEFIRALGQARQPFICAWDNGGHTGQRPDVSSSFKEFDIYQIRRDRCVPALANASTADDPGTGDPAEGDPVGAINDDFRWEVEKDTAEELVLRLWRIPKSGKFAEVTEATVDVTPRRRQAFLRPPGSQVTFKNLSANDGSVIQELQLTVEPTGLLTARQVRISLDPGSRLVFTTAPGTN